MKRKALGFTILELMVASAIAVTVIAGATAALVNALRSWRAAAIRAELHMDLETALERIRHDLRLSSVGIGLMAFYPADAAEYTAISFPLATPGADGLLARDADGNIIWDTTVVYHVRPGSPDELIRTTFRPRNQAASPSDLYNQLAATVQSTTFAQVQNAAMSAAGEVAASRVVFRNLVSMVFRPPAMSFDGYAPNYERARTLNWGSIVLSNGVHDLTFTVQRKHADSAGYKLGIDRFALSYSGSPREGEIVLPANTHPAAPYFDFAVSGGAVSAQDMSSHGARWSGNSQLTYIPNYLNAGPAGSRLTFRVANDLWCDTNFDNPPGVLASNCSRKIDRSFVSQNPFIPDTVISMDKGISWDVNNVADTAFASQMVTNLNIVNIIHGGSAPPAGIMYNGGWVRFRFHAGVNRNLYVNNVRIARRSSGSGIVTGTSGTLRFGGYTYVTIGAGANVVTDWLYYEINREHSYLLSWERKDSGGNPPPGLTDARVWQSNSHVMSYLDGLPDQRSIAVSEMEVWYPAQALYRSGVFDTRIDSPTFRHLSWTRVLPAWSTLGIRVRSAGEPDMSDACAWFPNAYFSTHSNNDIGAVSGGRYLQYEVLFGNYLALETALLRDVTIAWEAPTGIVDLTVDFARGPDYGIVTADVNGQAFIKGVEVELEIFREGPYGMESIPGMMEVRPLNTGR